MSEIDDLMNEPDQPEDRNESAVRDIKKFLADTGMSQAELCRKTGISTAVVSALLKGNYTGNVEENLKKVLAVIEQEMERFRSMLKKPTYVETSVSKTIDHNLALAQVDGRLLVIGGDNGAGKTITLTEFKRRFAATILIELNVTYGETTILYDIAKTIGMDGHTRKDMLFKGIIEILHGTDRMIIVDEADYLKVKGLDILRSIFDHAKVPVVLVGSLDMKGKIMKMRTEHKYFTSRMEYIELDELHIGDTQAIVETVIPNAKPAVIETFHSASKHNARYLTKLMLLAQRTAIRNDCEIDPAVIKKAAEHMII
jgi:DNA transposition AAA+ family ATPase